MVARLAKLQPRYIPRTFVDSTLTSTEGFSPDSTLRFSFRSLLSAFLFCSRSTQSISQRLQPSLIPLNFPHTLLSISLSILNFSIPASTSRVLASLSASTSLILAAVTSYAFSISLAFMVRRISARRASNAAWALGERGCPEMWPWGYVDERECGMRRFG